MPVTPPLPSGYSFADDQGDATPPLPSGYSFADSAPASQPAAPPPPPPPTIADANPLRQLPAEAVPGAQTSFADQDIQAMTRAPQRSAADAALEQTQGGALTLRPKAQATAAPVNAQQQLDQQQAVDRLGNQITPTERAPLSQGADAPAPDMSAETDNIAQLPGGYALPSSVGKTLGGLSQAQHAEQGAEQQIPSVVASTAAQPVKEIGGGVTDLAHGLADASASIQTRQDGGTVTPQAQAQMKAHFIQGLSKTIAGGGTVALAIDAPSILGIANAAFGGDVAALGAMGKLAASFAAGGAASYAGGKVADKFNLTPDAKTLLQTTLFFAPSLFGALGAQEGYAKAGDHETYVAGNDKFGVGIYKNPDSYNFGAKVGGARVNVSFPRTPDPMAVAAKGALDGDIATMSDNAKAEAAASAIVNGASPEAAVQAQKPQAPDFTPPDMKAGQLSPQTVADAAAVIRAVPDGPLRAQTLMEMHGKLAGWMAQQGRFVGPDGQLQIIKNPDQAQQLAAKLINDEVARHDQVAADAAKPAEQPQAKPAAAGGPSKLQQAAADKQMARVKTLVDANPELSDAGKINLIGKQLQVTPEDATRLYSAHQAAQLPTVGSKEQSVVAERPETLAAQLDALKAGTIKTVMLPAGQELPAGVSMPAGMKSVKTEGPGAGTYIYDPRKITPRTIQEASKAGTHGDLMGHVQTKEELAEGGKPTAAIVARTPDGTEIQTSEVDNGAAGKAQAEILAERHPDAQISVEPIDKVLSERLQGQASETPAAPESPASDSGKTDSNTAGIQKAAPLPKELAGAKPRFGYRDKNFELDFKDPRDLAAYTLSQAKPNKRHDDFLSYWKSQFPGKDDAFLAEHAKDVRDFIRDTAKYSDPGDGPIKVPNIADTVGKEESEWPEPEQKPQPSNDVAKAEEKPATAAEPYQPGPEIGGLDGKETTVKTADGNYPGRYRLVDLRDLIPSHDGNTFQPNPKYPQGVQERDYDTEAGKHRVTTQAQNFDPDYLVNTNPDAVNGPPIITPDGIVLGGNSRTMTLQRVQQARQGWAAYIDKLKAEAESFGFSRAAIADRNRPILVREIAAPKTMDEMERLASALNKSQMAPLAPEEKAVSAGRKITTVAMDEISRLIDLTGESASIRDMMREYGLKALEVLENSGVITAREASGYVQAGKLSEGGKDFIERALLGYVVDNSKVFATVAPSILNKLDGALAAIAHLAAENDEYNLISAIRDALDQHAEIAARGTSVELFQQQGGLLEQRHVNPVVDAIARKLAEKPTAVKKALRGFSADARYARPGQGGLLGMPTQAFESFNEWFGTKLTHEDYRDGLARGVSERDQRAEGRSAEEGDRGVSERGAGQPEAEGTRSADRGDGGPAGQDDKLAPRDQVDSTPATSGPSASGETGATAPVKSDGSSTPAAKPKSKLDTPRKIRNAVTMTDEALVKRATEKARKDASSDFLRPNQGNFMLTQLRGMDPKQMTVAEREGLLEYLGIGADEEYGTEMSDDAKRAAIAKAQGALADDPATPYQPQKDDRIRYRAKDGTEKTGRYKAAFGGGAVRIAPDGGGKPDVISKKNILGPADSPLSPVQKENAAEENEEKPVATLESRAMGEGTTLELFSSSKGKPFGVRLMDDDSGEVAGPIMRFDTEQQARQFFEKNASKSIAEQNEEKPLTMGQEKPEPEKAPAKKETLADYLYGEIAAGRVPKDNNYLRALVSKFDGQPAGNLRLKEAQEAMEVALVRRAREMVADNTSDRTTFFRLVDLYNSQPLLNIRTSTSMDNQAYSTPAPLAFAASRLAGITAESKVYEPTAGNGMLLIGATPGNVYANELNETRAASLKAQGFHVTELDASQSLPAKLPPMDAVISNPPFGSVKGANGKTVKIPVDGYKIGQMDHLIVAHALQVMKDDGRATLILGASRELGGQSTDDKIFFNWLYSHYNVTAHFELAGKLYNRQGANWPVRVINISGRQRSDRFSPEGGSIERVGTWKEVYDRFEQGLDSGRAGSEPSGPVGPLSGPSDDTGAVSKPAGITPPKPRPIQPGRGAGVTDRLAGAQPEPLPSSEIESAAGLAATDSDIRPDADAAFSDRLPEGGTRELAPQRDAGATGVRGSDLADPDNDFQVPYSPASSKKDKDVLIPKNMRDPLRYAMKALEKRVGDLDAFVTKELGYKDEDELHDALMGLQTDSVGAAIDQMAHGKGVIIADQTGIGKGRQAAAIIRWAVRNGHTPVFMSVKPTLFTDMFGDLADIGTSDIAPLIVNREDSISLPNNTTVFGNKKSTHRATLESIRDTGRLPAGRNALFLTYSQINTDNLQRDVLRAVAGKAIFVLDESHNAAGDSSTGDFMQSVLDEARGVTYLSATYAKRPDNMALYARTDIGVAVKDRAKLESAMAMGGLPLQTVIANNLVKAGQMFRRERSFAGISFNTVVDKANAKAHAALADKVTEALRAIVDADRTFHANTVPMLQKAAKGAIVRSGGNKADISVNHTEFSSVVHNFVRQMLLGIKADTAAEKAIAAIKAGEKPILALELTMGSFLQEYAADNRLKDGDPLGNFTYRTVLDRALMRSRAIIQKDKMGNQTKIPISLGDLDPFSRVAYDHAQSVIDALEIDDLPMSPIDWMRQRIQDAGHSVAEITGRELAVDYSDPKQPTLSRVPARELSNTGKVETARRFNDGRLDSLVINVAGSTGISLHASQKFQDQRMRRMIVVQPAQDINIFMQMLGRPNRTGQVRVPAYDVLAADLPAEKRPTALLAKKMKSLNANTSSNTESATSVKASDMLNKYGDEIVNNYLMENYKLARELGVFDKVGEHPGEDLARVATGRLAILPVEQQVAFYRDVEQQYEDYIQYLNETNQNDLEPRTFDYDAEATTTAVMVKGDNPSSPFGEDATYGEYSIKSQAKPLTAEDVQKAIKANLGEQTGSAHVQQLITALDAQYKPWHATLDPTNPSTLSAESARQSAINFIRTHAIGSTLRLAINGDEFSAAVTNIESTHKGAGNPFSMSKIKVTLATTGPQPNMKPPAIQLLKTQTALLHSTPDQIFAMHRPPTREIAKIVTGNLLAAYGEMHESRGTIINFTKKDGTTEQGILLPKKFDLQANTVGDYQMMTPEQALTFLRDYSKPEEARVIGISNREQDIRVLRGASGGIVLTAPKSKARGGKYYLDPAIVKATGDWVSRGELMRVEVPADKAKAVLAEVMKKTSLAVSRSMADEAREIAAGKPRPSSGSTMRASVFGADIAAQFVARTAMTWWEKDGAQASARLGKDVKEAAATVAHALMPTLGANRDVLDSMMRLKGDQERALFHVEQFFYGVEKMFDSLPEDSRIDFLDRFKRGEDQVSPELDKVAAMYRALDTATYQRIVEAQVGVMDRPARRVWDRLSAEEREKVYDELAGERSFALDGDREAAAKGEPDARKRLVLQRIANGVLSFKANHLRSFWKVVPGSLEERSTNRGRRSPLRGDRGFTKRSTLPDVSSGLAEGGVLESTNPQRLIEMGQKSSLRYITALTMWKELGDLGMRKFVRLGERAPDGWEKVNDGIAKVYYPAHVLTDDPASLPSTIAKEDLSTRKTIIHSGDWYLEQSAARLLNNYLSKDWFRTHAIGRGLMQYKMATTGIELGLSPFHLVFEAIEAMGSQFGLGMMRAWNTGLREGKPGEFLKGLGDAAAAPAAPVTMARAGGKAIQAERQGFKEFAANPANHGFLRAYPDAPHLIDLAFTGGLTMGMPREYRVQMMEGARAALKDGNYLGALARAVPGIAQSIMSPLFEHYIPALKMGFVLPALAQQLAEHHDAIIRGDASEAEIARTVVNSAENRFGELNFTNLWWNNTFKGVNQLLFRSVTWKLGNWRGATTGVAGQAQAFADPLKTMRDDAKGYRKGHQRRADEYIPKLDLNMSWLLGMAVTTAVLGTVLAKLLAGNAPWEFVKQDEARGMSAPGALALEMMHPRTGHTDSFTGLPNRISLPTGARDFEHAAEDPRGYLHGSLSGFVGKTLDTWDNRDFFGNYVYDPNGPIYQKLADILSYNAPLPIAMQQFLHGRTTGDFSQSRLGAMGMTKASTTLDMTPLEKKMEDIVRASHTPETPEAREEYRNKLAEIRDGDMSPKESREALREHRKPYLVRMFDKLTYRQARDAFENLANPEEQDVLGPALKVKRRNALRKGPNTENSDTSSDD